MLEYGVQNFDSSGVEYLGSGNNPVRQLANWLLCALERCFL